MIRARLLVWLLAAVALAIPPLSAGAAHAAAPQQNAMPCPDHAPPPVSCPDHDTAKHAAGTCCPSMAGALAVMPAAGNAVPLAQVSERSATAIVVLSSLSVVKDPPPPRV